MIAMTNFDIPAIFMRRFASSAIDVIIHLTRLTDGTRKVISLQEITGMEGDVITLQEIFTFQRTAIDKAGKVRGKFIFKGIRPRFIDKFEIAGIAVPQNLFKETKVVEV
jgi:pilus assembly protein CpaF